MTQRYWHDRKLNTQSRRKLFPYSNLNINNRWMQKNTKKGMDRMICLNPYSMHTIFFTHASLNSRLLHLKSTFLFCPPNKFKTPTIQYTAASVNIHSTKTSFSVLSCLPTCANQGE